MHCTTYVHGFGGIYSWVAHSVRNGWQEIGESVGWLVGRFAIGEINGLEKWLDKFQE